MDTELQSMLRRIGEQPGPAVLATLVDVAGSSYRRAGARLLRCASGERVGSISGGCLEADVLERAARVASSGVAELVTYDTTSENDLVWGVGLGCHGVVKVLIERIDPARGWAKALAANLEQRRPTPLGVVWRTTPSSLLGTHLAEHLPKLPEDSAVFHQTVEPPLSLAVFGAGDDAMPLVRFAKELGWHVVVADPRAEFATRGRFPLADRITVAPAAELVTKASVETGAAAVVMTHHYAHDVPLLRELLGRNLCYVGLLGPKKRAERILDDLARGGLVPSMEQMQRLHAPVGLDLGADTPAEVAVSIVAEIRAALGNRNARPLRERALPIHG